MTLNTQANVNTDVPEKLQTANTPSSAAGAEGSSSIKDAMANAATPTVTTYGPQSGTVGAPAAYTQTNITGDSTANNNANTAYNYQTVDQAYNSLVDTNSPMMQRAAAAAQRQAAQRGLGNSSMAVGAAQGAVSDTAQTMASQMASQSQQQALANRGTDVQQSQYDRSQTEAERAQQKAEEFTGRQMTEAERAAQVAESQNQQQISNQANQFQQTFGQQQHEFAQNLQLENQKLSQSAKEFAQSIQANSRGTYTTAVDKILSNSSVNINNISSNSDLTTDQKNSLIQQELNNRNNDLQYTQNLYGNITSWADRL